MRAVEWGAGRLGRLLLRLAVVVILTGVALAAVALVLATWPIRRLAGPSGHRAQLAAAQELALALAAFVFAIRAGKASKTENLQNVGP